MPESYFRCIHMGPDGAQCETWFKENGSKLCEEHQVYLRSKESLPSLPDETESKKKYIDLINEQNLICVKMSIEELEAHIDSIQTIIETEKTKYFTARANLRQKLDDLSDEERKVRLNHKLNKTLREERVKESQPSIKKNPVAALAKHGISATAARDFLTMDVDALMEKYKKSKGNKNA